MLGPSLAPVGDDWLTAGRASVFHHQLLVGSVEQTIYRNIYFSEYHDGVYNVVANAK